MSIFEFNMFSNFSFVASIGCSVCQSRHSRSSCRKWEKKKEKKFDFLFVVEIVHLECKSKACTNDQRCSIEQWIFIFIIESVFIYERCKTYFVIFINKKNQIKQTTSDMINAADIVDKYSIRDLARAVQRITDNDGKLVIVS